jgi:phosphatidate cytidylyltransferase
MSQELRNRLIFGVLFAALVIGAIGARVPWGLPLLVGVIVLLGAREFVRLGRSLAPALAYPLVAVPALAVALAAWCPERGGAALLALGLAIAAVLIEQMARRGIDGIFPQVGTALFGICYLGLPLHLLGGLGQTAAADGAPRGLGLLLVFVATVKLCDVTAFFGGKALGRNKMCPSISPGKTWEGFACSFIGAVGGAYLFTWLAGLWLGVQPFPLAWQPLVWGLILGPLGVLGDLAESAMKRAAAVKDSGSSMPGFGGVLDIYDALVIAAPVACLLARVL